MKGPFRRTHSVHTHTHTHLLSTVPVEKSDGGRIVAARHGVAGVKSFHLITSSTTSPRRKKNGDGDVWQCDISIYPVPRENCARFDKCSIPSRSFACVLVFVCVCVCVYMCVLGRRILTLQKILIWHTRALHKKGSGSEKRLVYLQRIREQSFPAWLLINVISCTEGRSTVWCAVFRWQQNAIRWQWHVVNKSS